jgi:Ca2+-binding EF-hand superfamily protein
MFKPTIIIAPVLLALTMASSPSLAAERNAVRGFADSSFARSADHARRNHDGRAVRLFNKLDTDDNGIVTLDEFFAISVEKAAHQFGRIDAEDDELISLDEFLAIHDDDESDIDIDALIACIVENSDFTEDDLPSNDKPNGSARFLEVDENGDGFIDLAEFEFAKTSQATTKFNRIDANGDGGITLEELRAVIESHSALRSVRRDCVQAQNDENDLIAG